MRPLLFLGLVTQLACWSEQTFTRDCIAAGHCLVSDSGVGGGGDIGGGGGGDIGGGGGGGTTGGGTGGGFVDDGGVITWAEVVSELFDAIPRGLDAGFTVAFTPTLSTGKWVGGVLTSDGRVVCIPAAGSNALRVSANGVVTVQDLGFSGGWEGGVLLSDGGVLGLPSVSATFLAAGPVSATEIAVGLPLSGASYPYFEGGVITLEGQVLLAPKNAIYPGVFDTFTNTLTVDPLSVMVNA